MNYEKRAKNWILKEKYGGQILTLPKDDSRRLQAGEPADYIIGWSSFLGCKIDLTLKPLIPRPETEYWVQKAIEEIKVNASEKRVIRCLDMFAGSGCIGIAIVKHIPQAMVDFVDNDPLSITQIKVNATINAIDPKHFCVIQSDLFQNVSGWYDYILANPPYCALNRKERVQTSVVQFEPAKAIWGGEEGLFYIKRFLQQTSYYLNDGGTIFMEFEDIQKRAIHAIVKRIPHHSYQFFKDQYHRFRFLKLKKLSPR